MTGPHDSDGPAGDRSTSDGSAGDTSAADSSAADSFAGEPSESTAASDPSTDADGDETSRAEAPSGSADAAETSGDPPTEQAEPAGHEDPQSTDGVATAIDDPDLQELLDETRTLHGKVRYIWIGRRLLPALFLAAIVGFAALYFDLVETRTLAVGIGAVAFVLLMVYAVVRSVLLYRSWRYVVRADSLYLTRGVFTKVQTVVPYVRVQHIDTSRSAFERVLGLSSLVVYTAGTRGADVTIPGLTPDRAERLQSRLKRLAIESEDEDAV